MLMTLDSFRLSGLILMVLSPLTSCSPRFVQQGQPKPWTVDATGPLTEGTTLPPSADSGFVQPPATPSGEIPASPSVYATGPRSFVFKIPAEEVWGAALEVLMGNYNLTLVGKDSGIITTEWDRFYLGEEIYRNKVSVRISSGSFRFTRLNLVNNVEILRRGESSGSLTPVWMPAKDISGESARIIRALASYLRQPPPVLYQDEAVQASGKLRGSVRPRGTGR